MIWMTLLLIATPPTTTMPPPTTATTTTTTPAASPPAAPVSDRPNPAGITWVKSQGLVIAKTETTVAQYKLCVAARRCGASDFDPAAKPDLPVSASWFHATDFCMWAAKRLPTVEEWETVATNGDTTPFPWGHAEPGPTLANFCDRNCRFMWKTADDDGFAGAAPVCSFPAGHNKDGVCDLAGNVTEWTVSTPPADERPRRQETRGGSFNSAAAMVRSTHADSDEQGTTAPSLGFRCVQ